VLATPIISKRTEIRWAVAAVQAQARRCNGSQITPITKAMNA
jgi:hypothetical protein